MQLRDDPVEITAQKVTNSNAGAQPTPNGAAPSIKPKNKVSDYSVNPSFPKVY
jgi:hypothetical protein